MSTFCICPCEYQCLTVYYLIISAYSLSLPLLSLHLRNMTDASTFAGEKVLGSLSREITLSRIVLMMEEQHQTHRQMRTWQYFVLLCESKASRRLFETVTSLSPAQAEALIRLFPLVDHYMLHPICSGFQMQTQCFNLDKTSHADVV